MCRWSAFRGIPLPKNWPECAKVAVIQCVSLAHRAITYSRSFAINSDIERVRLAGQLDRAQNEIALLREEIRIKDARMARLAPHRRPRYAAQERMAILELRAARAWNLAETGRAFLVDAETVSDWMTRACDAGDGLLELSQPVNKYQWRLPLWSWFQGSLPLSYDRRRGVSSQPVGVV